MDDLCPHRPPGRRTLRSLGVLAAAVSVVLAGCGLSARPDSDGEGPERISPLPRYDIAEEMVAGRGTPSTRLPACELLGLTTAEVAELTRTDLPDAEPTGSGDLANICTFGGPGSRERLAAEQEAATTGNGAPTTGTTTDGTTTATTPSPPPETGEVGTPDTVAAGVVKPRSGAPRALAGQPATLGARHACSEIRGAAASTVEGGPAAAPAAPAPIRPDLETAYIDCVATPAGGGVEVHTILIADNDLWHLTSIRPGTPRTPQSEAAALTGLHRLGETILG